MKMRIAVLVLSLLPLSSGSAQEPKVVQATFKVSGNCNLCKGRIEKALAIREVKSAKWDRKSAVVTIAYLIPSISLDSLQHRVAAVGHDTGKFKAPDEVYSGLPSCCRYRERNRAR